MTPAEVLWVSGLALGIVLGVPLGVILDRFILRPSVRVVLAYRAADGRR